MANSLHVAQRRRAILAAAEKVFDAYGYSAATMEAVAEQAGIAKGSIYNYFHGKQDLFTQVFTESMAADEANAEREVGTDSPAGQKLWRILDDWFVRQERYKRIGKLVLESWAVAAREEREGPLAVTFQALHDRWCRRLAAIVRQGIDSGEFAPQIDPGIAATMIMAVSNGLTLASILNFGVQMDETVLAAIKRAILAGLTRGRQNGQEI